ncbi:MAG TPA: hypothetical protein VLC09_15260 [Polyangiaceae bacterium]|nr:hypothetical protein [Polyangiaceae bacterium]
MSSPSRRQLLASGLAWMLAQLAPRSAAAVAREPYGGRLQLSLPLDAERLDPHEADDLGAALLGGNLFESLFALDGRGQPYPTLAAELPEERRGRLHLRLRPELHSARGKLLDAADAVASLTRAERAQPWLPALGPVRRESSDVLSFPLTPALELAQRLASSRFALVPSDFDAGRPDGHGAFVANRSGTSLELLRNVNAARGGSYLDAVGIECSELSECLRAFESGRSELGWLGDGLYQKRAATVPFRLAPLGFVYVRPGRKLGRLAAPGVLTAALEATPSRALDALGYQRTTVPTARAVSGLSGALCYPRGAPQLRATAEALAEAWSTAQTRIEPRELGRQEASELRKRGDFELMLGFARTAGLDERALHSLLFHLDGAPVPTRFTPEPPERLVRRLGLGIVGWLAPSGACVPSFAGALTGAAIELTEQKIRPIR